MATSRTSRRTSFEINWRVVPGASIPQPFGGPWRQIQFYVDPYKLEARQISPMDVVRSLNQANVILPAGDVQIGNLDYNIYSNAQFNLKDASQYPIKMNGENPVLMSDVGELRDAHALQYNVVHVNGQRSVYLPVMKQGRRFEYDFGCRRASARSPVIWWMFPQP